MKVANDDFFDFHLTFCIFELLTEWNAWPSPDKAAEWKWWWSWWLQVISLEHRVCHICSHSGSGGRRESALLLSPWPDDAPGHCSGTNQPTGRCESCKGFRDLIWDHPCLSCRARWGGPGAQHCLEPPEEPEAQSPELAHLLPESAAPPARGAGHRHLHFGCWSLCSFLILLLVWSALRSLVCRMTFQLLANNHPDNSGCTFFFSKTGDWEALRAERSDSSLLISWMVPFMPQLGVVSDHFSETRLGPSLLVTILAAAMLRNDWQTQL